MHVITPSDLKKDAIERYSEMLLKPRSDNHERFLKQQLKQLQNENTDYSLNYSASCGFNNSQMVQKRSERLC